MRILCCAALLLAIPLARAAETPALTPVMAPAAAPAPRWIDAAKIDYRAIVPPPPAEGSAAAQQDIETLLNVQAARTANGVAWAKVAERDTIFNHAEIIGAWFTKENLPKTAEFFATLGGDLRPIDGVMKQPFLRPRPHVADKRVKPCVELPKSTSYPSGTAMQALVWAALLAEIFPDHREALFARAQRIGWGRVLGGVHYPTDLSAGRAVGGAVVAELLKNEEFLAALGRCRIEADEWQVKQPRG